MAAINFPDSPVVNDLFTYNSITYRWDGVKWKAVSNINNILPSQTGNADFLFSTTGTEAYWKYPADITVGAANAISNVAGWSITPSGTKLLFKYNGTNVGSLDSSGNFIVTGNVTAYGTP